MIDQPPAEAYGTHYPVSLISIIRVLWHRRWLVIGTTFAGAVGVVAFSVASLILPPAQSPLPNVYTPQAVVLVREGNDASSLRSSFQDNLGGMAAIAGLGQASSSMGELAVALLETRSVLNDVVEEVGFIERYQIVEAPKTSARKALLANSEFDYDSVTRLLRIKYEDIDPQFATAVVNSFVDRLNERFVRIGGSRAVTRRDILQEKLAEVETRIRELEAEIVQFQRTNGVLDVRTITERQAQTLANLRSDLIVKEMQIQSYREFARIDDPVLDRLETERENLRDLIEQFEAGDRIDGAGPSQQDIPELALRYERLRRTLEVQTRVHESLAAEYEIAKLNAQGQEPTLQVLERATEPEEKSGPSRSVLSVLVTLGSFIFAVLLVFLIEYVNKIRTHLTYKDDD